MDSSYVALGWPAVSAFLAARTRTPMGARAAASVPLATGLPAVRATYALVAEVQSLQATDEVVPVAEVLDVAAEIGAAGRSAVLARDELRRVGGTLGALLLLRRWVDARATRLPGLAGVALPVQVDPLLVETLQVAFDPTGELDGAVYPELARLRDRITSLRARIRTTLDELLRDEEVQARLQDRYVTERNGRWVLPVKANARRGFGISHGSSQSGETVYVEPHAVVEVHNDLREAESDLEREEHAILASLSRQVGEDAPGLLAALDAVAELDLLCARERLGWDLEGHIPTVGDEGVLVARAARHPLLALAGTVVPNDLSLTSARPALVLTGPNAGGKTVALKTLGLFALLVRAGIPVPAKAPTRVDVFDPVVAEIGDAQSVEEGLSTFSAHLRAMKSALDAARPGALVLVDEIAVGTDPSQGAALARAVVEALLDRGARVAITTHYPELKVVTDPRFAVAAAQFEEGRPTFRLVAGAPGASMPLAVARRLGVPEDVLERAASLLEAGARELAARLETLDEEVGRARVEREGWERRNADLALRARDLEARERRVRERADKEVAAAAQAFKERLREKEEEVRALVAALQADPSLKRANQVLAEVREAAVAQPAPEAPAAPPPPTLAVGDRVRLRALGTLATVRTVNPNRVEIEVGAIRSWVDPAMLEPVSNRSVRAEERAAKAKARDEAPARAREEAPARDPAADGRAFGAVRVDANTCDLRGLRVEDALGKVDSFLAAQSLGGFPVVFLLHGHGTGALKAALRTWLPQAASVRRWRPAAANEGGDAFTIVELR